MLLSRVITLEKMGVGVREREAGNICQSQGPKNASAGRFKKPQANFLGVLLRAAVKMNGWVLKDCFSFMSFSLLST